MMNSSVFRGVIDLFSLTGCVVHFAGHFTGEVAYLMRSLCVEYFMRGCRVHALKCLLLDQCLVIDVISVWVVNNDRGVVFFRLLLLFLPLPLSLRRRGVDYICLLQPYVLM